ncbi:MAG: methylenetetrahydrofolate reductase C-terminal domain-containing protein [Proteobacteria bacterium]|nr:methylenetetrahydrofolate reductase C-terminal domain-containing protein [Pseudomonadota bacterium]
MIVAERKGIQEIKQMVEQYSKILVAGCGTCVAVCMAGGEREVSILASMLRMAFKIENGKEVEIGEITMERQCDREFIEPFEKQMREYEVVISTACGIGIQFLSDFLGDIRVFPGVNTKFLGSNEGEGTWFERCRACGECVLGETGGICPITLCAKNLLNGPCGGTNKGKCEVDKEKDCAWTLIYRRLEKLGGLDSIRRIFPPKNYHAQTHPSRMIHEAYKKD